MTYPKIIFHPMPLEDNIELVKWTFFENNDSLDIYNYTIEYFPELANVNSKKHTKEQAYNLIEKVISSNYSKNINKIKEKVQQYNQTWTPYNDKYFMELCNYLNAIFPQEIKTINAYVGLIPVFPRYLDSFSFAISPDIDNEKLIETCAHEICHFLWFTKWKELYPNYKKEEFESPYITWKYSEMIVDPVLNSKNIKNVININTRTYDIFYTLKDNNTYVMSNLKKIYNSNNTIEHKIKKGYEYIYDYFNSLKAK